MIKYIWAWADSEDVYLNSCDSLIDILHGVLENEFDEVDIETVQNDFLIKLSSSYLDENTSHFSIEANAISVTNFLIEIMNFDDRYNRFEIRKLEIEHSISF
jgi:uncharacterized protein YbcC (UPF0753/DUF2309 family)